MDVKPHNVCVSVNKLFFLSQSVDYGKVKDASDLGCEEYERIKKGATRETSCDAIINKLREIEKGHLEE